MYKVKQLYAEYTDFDGHSYLVPKESFYDCVTEIENLEECLVDCEDSFDFDSMLEDILDDYKAVHIEGEMTYVVLKNDIVD